MVSYILTTILNDDRNDNVITDVNELWTMYLSLAPYGALYLDDNGDNDENDDNGDNVFIQSISWTPPGPNWGVLTGSWEIQLTTLWTRIIMMMIMIMVMMMIRSDKGQYMATAGPTRSFQI